MAVLPDYVSGTITLANGSTAVTGTGTLFDVAKFREGDTLQIQNLTAVIASVDSNTSLTLTVPWTGASLTDASYRARYLPDGARVTAQTTTLIELLGNGVLSNLAELGVEDGKAPVGNAAGDYELKPVPTDPNGSLGKLAAVTLGNRQILQTDGAGNLTVLTLVARQILQTDANGALKAIALVANRMLVTDANADVASRPIVGTVSQSGGVPTGAIIERGSNANGQYVKWADGTLICYKIDHELGWLDLAVGSLWRSSGNQTWTYPVAFASRPSVTGLPNSGLGYTWIGAGTSNNGLMSVALTLLGPTAVNQYAYCSLMAIGRWF